MALYKTWKALYTTRILFSAKGFLLAMIEGPMMTTDSRYTTTMARVGNGESISGQSATRGSPRASMMPWYRSSTTLMMAAMATYGNLSLGLSGAWSRSRRPPASAPGAVPRALRRAVEHLCRAPPARGEELTGTHWHSTLPETQLIQRAADGGCWWAAGRVAGGSRALAKLFHTHTHTHTGARKASGERRCRAKPALPACDALRYSGRSSAELRTWKCSFQQELYEL